MSSQLTEASHQVGTPGEETSAVKPSVPMSRHCWAVMLAGGDGTRLQSLTTKIAGDARPKQFCFIVGKESLLAQTRARLESIFCVDRQVFVVTRAHERYYREELRNVDDSRIIPQPLNRGTGVAIAVVLLHIMRRDPEAVVVFVPCDHYYSDAQAFGRAVRLAFSGAEKYPDSVVLLGAKANYAEVEYGWIEPGAAISNAPGPLLRVKRFWEKPSIQKAQALLRRGCLWNTFVIVGRASTFVELLRSQCPEVILSINNALEENELEAAYRLMPAVDLSRHVLALHPDRLLAIPDTTSGWVDLGSPARVMDTLARDNIQPAWLHNRHRLSMPAPGPRHPAGQDNNERTYRERRTNRL
jgi:mannose-1-phosphate guanylyltransferase